MIKENKDMEKKLEDILFSLVTCGFHISVSCYHKPKDILTYEIDDFDRYWSEASLYIKEGKIILSTLNDKDGNDNLHEINDISELAYYAMYGEEINDHIICENDMNRAWLLFIRRYLKKQKDE